MMNPRRLLSGALALGAVLALALPMLASCADPLGLHNQEAARVTFVLTDVPATDGSWSLPGDYQSTAWDNTESLVTLSGGSGTSAEVMVTDTTITFTLVPEGAWTRSWYPTMKGNSWDYNSGGKQWNFQATGIPLGQDVTITIDGSTSPATVTIQ